MFLCNCQHCLKSICGAVMKKHLFRAEMRDVLFPCIGDNRSLCLQEPSILQSGDCQESVQLYISKKSSVISRVHPEITSPEPVLLYQSFIHICWKYQACERMLKRGKIMQQWITRAEKIGRQPVPGLICNAAQYFPSDPSSA